MESLPKVVAMLESEITKLDTILGNAEKDISAKVASEQAGLGKLLSFAREITTIQAKFEAKLKTEQ